MKKIFKTYQQNEQYLLPPSLEDLIPQNHLVKMVNRIIDGIEIENIIINYRGGGAPAYNPKMLLKVIIYGYLEGIYTGRKIAKALRENVNFMWLSAMQRPDFRTINNFRSGRLKVAIKDVFKQVVEVAIDLGFVDFEKLFVDGTTIEANANKHKIIWSKNVRRHKENINKKIDLLLKEIERINEEEDEMYKDKDLPELGESIKDGDARGRIKCADEVINKVLYKRKQKLLKEKEKLEKRKDKYEEQEKILSGRNGYSKTDPDATATMMKNEEIKPGYTIMSATENQIIVNYNVKQSPGESHAFVGLMEDTKKRYRVLPDKVVGDQAYGSEENYMYCKDKGIKGFLKYNTFHLEKTKKFRENRFLKENFRYDKERDLFICPNDKELRLERIETKRTQNKFTQRTKAYICNECSSCSMKNLCTKGKNRSIQINENLERLKAKAKRLLESEEGIYLRKQRSVDVETPFGDIKHNQKFRRFQLRGLDRVNIDVGLVSIAHNIKKIFKKMNNDITMVGDNFIFGFKFAFFSDFSWAF